MDILFRPEEIFRDGSPEPRAPKIGQEYVQNDLGQFEMRMDFRSNPEEHDYEVRPRVSPGQLYTDEEFPLWVAMGKDPNRKTLEWKRPREFAEKPCLFSEGTSRYDIGQGSIGTCWFLASVANIADKPKLLRRIIPRDSYPLEPPNYDGIFHCRFWRFGIWDDVFIDDYLPIIHGYQIYSAQSDTDRNEMWVSLLEKAFARMYGSYTEVSGGASSDSYMALTGGVPEDIDLKKLDMEPDQLHTRVRNALYSNAAVTCGTPETFVKKYGILGKHEYTINGAVTAKGVRLFRLRNPWGKTEWIGPYSDGSREWQSIQGIIEGPNRDDGEFYISLEHFLYLFSTLTICNITPDFDSDGRSDSLNYCTSLYGQWQGEEAGGFQNRMKNPKFQFEIDEQSLDQNGTVPFVVQLIQRTKRRTAQILGIRADLYQVLENASDDILVLQEEGIPSKNYTYTYSKHTQISFRFSLKPGKYVCIPSAMNEGQEREFMLRLFSAGPLGGVKKIDSNEVTIMTCDGEDAKSYDHVKCLTGQWRAGSNAGGQVSNKTFHINPQIKIKSSDQRVKFQLMVDSKAPIGLMLFKLKGESVPVGIDWLYKHYRDAVRMTDGDDGPFIKGTSAPAVYSLEAGSYVCLLHMDQPDTERRFALVIRSQTPLYNIEPHQME